MIDTPMQEFMVAMECLFYEWYENPGSGEGMPFGRQAVSNNTAALEIVTKEGGVSCMPCQIARCLCRSVLTAL